WNLQGTGDFNGDGMSDIVWRHTGGQTVLWEMNGGARIADLDLSAISSDWHIQGIGDFNADGHSDIFWRRAGSTGTVLWEMNGGTRIADLDVGLSGFLATSHIQGVADFNGDGRGDILWREDDGATHMALMDGAHSVGIFGFAIPADWHVASLGD